MSIRERDKYRKQTRRDKRRTALFNETTKDRSLAMDRKGLLVSMVQNPNNQKWKFGFASKRDGSVGYLSDPFGGRSQCIQGMSVYMKQIIHTHQESPFKSKFPTPFNLEFAEKVTNAFTNDESVNTLDTDEIDKL